MSQVVLQPNIQDLSQPSPFLMPLKLLILHGEAKSYCFTISCSSFVLPPDFCHLVTIQDGDSYQRKPAFGKQ